MAAQPGPSAIAPPAAVSAPFIPAGPGPLFGWGVAVYLAVVVSRVHEAVPALSIVRPALLAAVALMVLIAVEARRLPLSLVSHNPTMRWMVLIAALAAVSIPGAIWPGHSAGFVTSVLVQLLVLLVVTALACANRQTMRLALGAVAFGAVLAAALAMTTQVLRRDGRYQIGGTYDPNETGALFVMALPILFMFVAERGKLRPYALLGVPILLAGIVKTGSRGAIVALALLTPFFLTYAPPRARAKYLAMIALCAAVFSATASDELRDRLASVFSQNDYNFTEREGRKAVWTRGIGYMMDNPVLGVGVDGFPYAEGASLRNEGFGVKFSAAHNAYIQIGAELGVLGLVAYLAAFGTAWAGCRRAHRSALQAGLDAAVAQREAALATTTLGSLLAVAITGVFLSLAYSNLTYFALGACVGLAAGAPAALRVVPVARMGHVPTQAEAVAPPRRARAGGVRQRGGLA